MIKIKQLQQGGFTLIELMIVVAIIGILASIALPAYQEYTIKTKVSEGVMTASSLRIGIAEKFGDGGINGIAAFSNQISDEVVAGTILTSKITNVVVNPLNGEITVTMGGIPQLTAGLNVLGFRPTINNLPVTNTNNTGSMNWDCNSITNGGLTTIINKYLPAECR